MTHTQLARFGSKFVAAASALSLGLTLLSLPSPAFAATAGGSLACSGFAQVVDRGSYWELNCDMSNTWKKPKATAYITKGNTYCNDMFSWVNSSNGGSFGGSVSIWGDYDAGGNYTASFYMNNYAGSSNCYSTAYANKPAATTTTASSSPLGYCGIHVYSCPNNAAYNDKIFNDYYYDNSSAEQCYSRANDWQTYCGSTDKVDSWYHNASLVHVGSYTAPAKPKGYCGIHVYSCPNNSAYNDKIFNDYYTDNSSASQCYARALDWQTYCGSNDKVDSWYHDKDLKHVGSYTVPAKSTSSTTSSSTSTSTNSSTNTSSTTSTSSSSTTSSTISSESDSDDSEPVLVSNRILYVEGGLSL